MSLFIVTLGFTLAISSKWAYSYFGLSSFEQIVYHIKVPLEGTNTQFIFGWMKKNEFDKDHIYNKVKE